MQKETHKFSQSSIEQINQLAGFLSFKRSWMLELFLRLPLQIICFFTGNQAGKTATVTYERVLRIFGRHFQPRRNVFYLECPNWNDGKHVIDMRLRKGVVFERAWNWGHYGPMNYPDDLKCRLCGETLSVHQRNSRIFRFAAETLPTDKSTVGHDGLGASTEIRNSVYPALKKWIPKFLIKKDITVRNPSMTIKDPLGGMVFGNPDKCEPIAWPGEDIILEFVSYSQDVQATAGTQRLAIHCDEEPSKDFWDEQIPRLLAEDGDMTLTLTPARRLSWTFDELFERSSVIYRTPAIREFLNEGGKKDINEAEEFDVDSSIATIQAATDDNPTLNPDAVKKLSGSWADSGVEATRRYGVHAQSSGRIFDDFLMKVHVISPEKYFSAGVPSNWLHARAEDYHESNNHAIVWAALSHENELFVYNEWNPSPKRYVTLSVCEGIADRSELEQRFALNLIDPLAVKLQSNSGTSVIEDMNNIFYELKRDGRCTHTYFKGWNTKGTHGREMIRARLKNSRKVMRPFENKIVQNGKIKYLPTIWVFNNCHEVAKSLQGWRLEQWAAGRQNEHKDPKEVPSQKWSHFCTALEALHKDSAFRPPVQGVRTGGKRTDGHFKINRRRRRAA